MTYRIHPVLLLVASVMVAGAGDLHAQASEGLTPRTIVRLKPDHPPGTSAREILRRAREPLSATTLSRLSQRAGVGLNWVKALSDGSHVLAASSSIAPSAAQISQRLRQAPEVERAEIDVPMHTSAVASDPLYSEMWHLKPPVWGSFGTDFQTAWDLVSGSASVRVAVIDTGVLPHPDLVGAGGTVSPPTGALASEGYDFISDCRIRATCTASTPSSGAAVEPAPGATDRGDWVSAADQGTQFFSDCERTDSSWHGSHVAGTVLAQANNLVGIAGGAYDSKLLPVRVLGKCGGYMSDVAEALRWAAGVHPTIANPTPARVLNLSLGASGSCGTTMQAAIDAAVAAGAMVVVSAGNEASDASDSMLPSCLNVVTVAATNKAGDLAYYSNYSSSRIALAAPGGDTRHDSSGGILSLSNTGTTTHDSSGWAYQWAQGTSSAAPHLSAAAALVLARNEALTPTQLKALLVHSSSVTAFPDGSRCKTQGDCGAGIVNAYLVAANAVSPLTTSTDLLDYGSVALNTVATSDLTVSNNGNGSTTVGTISVSGHSGFAVASDACSGQTLAPAHTCIVQISFTATADGSASGTLGIPTSAGTEATLTTVSLAAAVGSKLTSDPVSMTLDNLVVGQTSSVVASFENRYVNSERVALVTLGGEDAAIASNGCSNVELAPGASCDVTVTFTPQNSGEMSWALTANTDGALDVPFAVAISAQVAELTAAESGDNSSYLTSNDMSSRSGGGGCTVLRSGGLPDVTLALLTLVALGAHISRQRKLGRGRSTAGTGQR